MQREVSVTIIDDNREKTVIRRSLVFSTLHACTFSKYLLSHFKCLITGGLISQTTVGFMKFHILTLLLVLLINTKVAKGNELRRSMSGRKSHRSKRIRESDTFDNTKVRALDISYPLTLFALGNSIDWRSPAVHNPAFEETAKAKEGEYLDHSLAQDQEDVWLYENWFYGMQNGVIMESGALNGLSFSTSYMFESFGGWTALHVEADPENYKNLRGNREQAVNVHAALCSEPQLLHYISSGMEAVRGFYEFMTEGFIKQWHSDIASGKVDVNSLPATQCVPFRLLMKELHVTHIDIWVLDTEGAEESVLKGTDFSEVQINAVAMECDEHDIAKNKRKTDILEGNGFQCQLIMRNCMCKNKLFTPHKAPVLNKLKEFKSWGDYAKE